MLRVICKKLIREKILVQYKTNWDFLYSYLEKIRIYTNMEKLKTNFIIINLKKYIVSIMSVSFIVDLVLYSTTNLQAAKDGLKLWANSVVPSLFPFFVATEILCNTNLVYFIRKIFKKTDTKNI